MSLTMLNRDFFNYAFVVEEIMIRTPPATLQKIYNLPEFGSTLEFLTMLALSGGKLLKVKSRQHVNLF